MKTEYIQIGMGIAMIAGDYLHLPFTLVMGVILVSYGSYALIAGWRAGKVASANAERMNQEVRDRVAAAVAEYVTRAMKASEAQQKERGH